MKTTKYDLSIADDVIMFVDAVNAFGLKEHDYEIDGTVVTITWNIETASWDEDDIEDHY